MFHKITDKMNSTKLKQFEIENIEDVLPMFEETFKIKFVLNADPSYIWSYPINFADHLVFRSEEER